MLIDPIRFNDAYQDAVADVMAFVTRERQEVIAHHNLGLHPDRTNLETYLLLSTRRYVHAIELLNRHSTVSFDELCMLDVGGFLGAFPLALVRLGIPVTLVEEYSYYGDALNELKEFLEEAEITIWAVDFTIPLASDPVEQFTFVTNMAMLEHLPSSPKTVLENLRRVTKSNGHLILEVPNLAYWPNRLRLLRGRSIHQAFNSYYATAPPFLGHHREYTQPELYDALRWSSFAIDEMLTFNYSLRLRDGALVQRLQWLIVYWWVICCFYSCRETIMACASPIEHAGQLEN
jgi:2-polyprenyl-3-methyl-5-hydroxy-6-metoxy-1,4-benzoquinol methylase